MSDEKFAEELQFQEALMASFINSNTPPRDSSPPSKPKEAGESSKSFCEICAERRENDQMFHVHNCSHSCCITCVTRYISSNITKLFNLNRENSAVLTCPVGLDCGGVLEIDACREIVPKYVISMWDDAICESMLDASQKFYCPYKDCSSLMVNDSGEAIREAECLSCKRLVCVQCNVPWHSGFGCEEFKGMDESERGLEDLMLHQLAKEKKWQRCPRCKFFVEKNEGCLHMTCSVDFNFAMHVEELGVQLMAAAHDNHVGKMSCLLINDIDAGLGRFGNTQATVNNQIVVGTLMNISDNPTRVSIGQEWRESDITHRIPIIVTGNDLTTIYAPLIRDGRMDKFYWQPTQEDIVNIVYRMYEKDGMTKDEVISIVEEFPNQALDFYGALRSRTYDRSILQWVNEAGGSENLGKTLLRQKKEGKLPVFTPPEQTVEALLESGYDLVREQKLILENKLSKEYMKNMDDQ